MPSISSQNESETEKEPPPSVVWFNKPYKDLFEAINTIYDEVVFLRRNLFKTTSGKSGKALVNELTFWLKQFNSNTKLNGVAMKCFLILPSLLLQKPSSKSKAKDHSSALERRLIL